ncbi:MAG: hypothetical protein AB7U29_16555 [Desulfobulbus sp.]
MNDTTKILLYATGLYVTFLCSGLYLAHGEEVPGLPAGPNQSYSVASHGTTPKEYIVPRISSTDAPLRRRDSKSCREYLAICERSCKERGTLFKFQCIGRDFQPFQDHSRCQCADDMYHQQQISRKEKAEQVLVKEEKPAEKKQ